MKIRAALVLLAGGACFAGTGTRCLWAQQGTPSTAPLPAACGVDPTDFKTKRDGPGVGMTTPPPGKALVYVIEQMPPTGFLTTKVKLGVDGRWVGQTERQSFLSFVVDPGVHHLCATYEGSIASPSAGPTILHRLNAEAGKTYYLLYRGLVAGGSGGIVGFFDEVDEDEGRYLLQSSDHMTSVATKK